MAGILTAPLPLLPTLPLKKERLRGWGVVGMFEATCPDMAEETSFEHLECRWVITGTGRKSPGSSASRITTGQLSSQNITTQNARPVPKRLQKCYIQV